MLFLLVIRTGVKIHLLPLFSSSPVWMLLWLYICDSQPLSVGGPLPPPKYLGGPPLIRQSNVEGKALQRSHSCSFVKVSPRTSPGPARLKLGGGPPQTEPPLQQPFPCPVQVLLLQPPRNRPSNPRLGTTCLP